MFFAYSAPIPQAALASLDGSPVPAMPLLLLCAGLVLAIVLALSGSAPARAAPSGPVFCERAKRWRDPVSGRLVKSPV